ncbi:MAG: hypothetical protein AAF550_08755 [Myxococcota bacterium]
MARLARLGDMLVAAGLVTEEQVDEALSTQKLSGRRLGEELTALGLLTEVQLTQILSNQLSIPWVSLYHVQFSRTLLDLVSPDLAEEYCLIPVYRRSVRHDGDTLFVAMDDPTNQTALSKVRSESGLAVKAMVAPPGEIRNAIRIYYQRTIAAPIPVDQPTIPAPELTAPSYIKTSDTTENIRPLGTPENAPVRGGGTSPKAMTLTFLDGTSVMLSNPQAHEEQPSAEEPSLTVSELFQALVARDQGQEVSDVLEGAGWERVSACLMKILIRKGLIAEWEFLEEWRRCELKTEVSDDASEGQTAEYQPAEMDSESTL